jgi:hypothetical protein
MTFSFLFGMRYAGRQPVSLLYDGEIKNFAPKLAAKLEGIKAFRKPVFLVDSLCFFGYFCFKNSLGDRSTVGQRTLTP